MPSAADIKLYKAFQKSPILFIEKQWGLVPQKLKPEFKDVQEFKAEYFEEFQKGKNITWQQYSLLIAVEKAIKGEALKRITVESGHGTGKSTVLAWLILWYLFCFKNAQIPCTAPTSEQMHDVLWKEIRLWLDRMPKPISSLYEWMEGYVRIKESPKTWFARAKTARKEAPEALAGVHGDFVMFIIDEASGVPEEIFNVAEGALTGPNVLVIMISNHTRLIGYFHDSHNKDKKNWQRLSFDSEESPIVDESFVLRIEEKHGRDSDEFRIRVKGKAPKEDAVDDKGYVPLLNDTDIRIGADCSFIGSPKMGVDPSGEGDDTTEWVVRDRFKAKCRASEKISNSMSIAAKTLALMDLDQVQANVTFIDNFGEGANVAVEMARAQRFAHGVNVGDKAEDDTRFLNKRAEAYWRAREWLRQGGELVGTGAEQLKAELLTIRYRYALRGKIQIMGKEEMRKQSIRSPNKADAFMLTFVEPDRMTMPTVTVTEQDEDPYSVF